MVVHTFYTYVHTCMFQHRFMKLDHFPLRPTYHLRSTLLQHQLFYEFLRLHFVTAINLSEVKTFKINALKAITDS